MLVRNTLCPPYTDSSLDAVIAANTLHIVPFPEKALAELLLRRHLHAPETHCAGDCGRSLRRRPCSHRTAKSTFPFLTAPGKSLHRAPDVAHKARNAHLFPKADAECPSHGRAGAVCKAPLQRAGNIQGSAGPRSWIFHAARRSKYPNGKAVKAEVHSRKTSLSPESLDLSDGKLVFNY